MHIVSKTFILCINISFTTAAGQVFQSGRKHNTTYRTCALLVPHARLFQQDAFRASSLSCAHKRRSNDTRRIARVGGACGVFPLRTGRERYTVIYEARITEQWQNCCQHFRGTKRVGIVKLSCSSYRWFRGIRRKEWLLD